MDGLHGRSSIALPAIFFIHADALDPSIRIFPHNATDNLELYNIRRAAKSMIKIANHRRHKRKHKKHKWDSQIIFFSAFVYFFLPGCLP
jgi:hypothetical protein